MPPGRALSFALLGAACLGAAGCPARYTNPPAPFVDLSASVVDLGLRSCDDPSLGGLTESQSGGACSAGDSCINTDGEGVLSVCDCLGPGNEFHCCPIFPVSQAECPPDPPAEGALCCPQSRARSGGNGLCLYDHLDCDCVGEHWQCSAVHGGATCLHDADCASSGVCQAVAHTCACASCVGAACDQATGGCGEGCTFQGCPDPKTPRCDPMSAKCGPCVLDADCDRVFMGGTCNHVTGGCDPPCAACACIRDSDCPRRVLRCNHDTGTCGLCASNLDCPPGEACVNAGPWQCVPPL